MKKLLVLTLAFCITYMSHSQLVFSPAITYVNTINAGDALLVDDLDADGDLDIVSARAGGVNSGAGLMKVFENGGDNISVNEYVYDLSTGYPYSTGQLPSYLYPHFGDYDGDGDYDFVAYANGCCQGGEDYGEYVIMESTSGLLFEQIVSGWMSNDLKAHLVPYDFNGDGMEDALKRNNGANNNEWWELGISNGTYSEMDDWFWDQSSYDYPITQNLFVIDDLNEDNIADVLCVGNSLYFFTGQEDCCLATIPFQLYSGQVNSMVSGDWNNDGKKDIVTTSVSGEFGLIEHFAGNTFYEWQEISNPNAYQSFNDADDPVILHDFNYDDFPDLLMRGENSLKIIMNDNGVLGDEILLSNDIQASTIQVVDFDGDELMDVVCYNGNGAIVYFLNSTMLAGCTDPEACNYSDQVFDDNGSCTYPLYPYDCEGNCLNDTDENGICDEFEGLPGFNPDANGDGVIDVTDLLSIIPLFGMPFEADPCIGPE